MHDFFVFDYNQKLQEPGLQDVATQSGSCTESAENRLSNSLRFAAFCLLHFRPARKFPAMRWLHLSRGQLRRMKTHFNQVNPTP